MIDILKNNFVVITVIIILTGTGGFFAGVKYQQSRITASRQNSFRQFNQGTDGQNQGRRQFSGRPVAGEIINRDEKSITVKMLDGQSKIVILSDTTQINQASQAAKTDLKEGVQVAVFGTENSDGSVTAQNIQLNPATRRMFDQGQGRE